MNVIILPGVERIVTFKEWDDMICTNFEKFYWISSEPDPNEKNPELIFTRGIYRDSYLATHFWADSQFRPNSAISMCVVCAVCLFVLMQSRSIIASPYKYIQIRIDITNTILGIRLLK